MINIFNDYKKKNQRNKKGRNKKKKIWARLSDQRNQGVSGNCEKGKTQVIWRLQTYEAEVDLKRSL